MLPITMLFTGLLGLLFMFHTVRVILARRSAHITLGMGDSDALLRTVRIHGNFSEYVPLLLLIMALLELSAVSETALYAFGISVVAGRLLHFYGIYSPTTPGIARIIGMVLTFIPLILGSVALILLAL
jgi:uncharacterized membrane protein YecN with MAPEG domain